MRQLEHFAHRLREVEDAELVGSFASITVADPRGFEPVAHAMTRVLRFLVQREIARRGIVLGKESR